MKNEWIEIKSLIRELITLFREFLAYFKEKHLAESQDLRPGPCAEYYDETGRRQLYDERQLMTVKEAIDRLHVSRFKLDEMRASGKLRTLKKDPADREVRLLRSEVEAARVWYSIPKGKV